MYFIDNDKGILIQMKQEGKAPVNSGSKLGEKTKDLTEKLKDMEENQKSQKR